MLCSVVIPTLGRQTLPRAMDSVLRQPIAASEIEIIVVNDSGKRLDLNCYESHPNITVVDSNRSGLAHACNTGASIAKGEYLQFLHDDDYLLDNGLIALLSAACNSGCKWVIGSAVIADDHGKKLYEIDSVHVRGNILAEFVANASSHVSYCLFHRRTFLGLGGFTVMKSSEDRDLFARLSLYHDVTSTTMPVSCVIRSGGEASHYRNMDIKSDYRITRERILDTRYQKRLSDSLKGRVSLRGRVCRQIIFSSILNLIDLDVFRSMDRLFWGCYFANFYVVYPSFWKGLLKDRA